MNNTHEAFTELILNSYHRHIELNTSFSITDLMRLLGDPDPERGHFGDTHPCELCGGYGFGLDNGKHLCIRHWLGRVETALHRESMAAESETT